MIEWGTVELREILWTLAAIPGLWFWFRNYLYARGTAKMVKGLDVKDGRSLWARFSVSLTRGLIGLELVFMFIGIRAFVNPSPPPSANSSALSGTIGAWITALLLIVASIGISYLGIRWKMVDDALLASARNKSRAKERQMDHDHHSFGANETHGHNDVGKEHNH